ncbi:SCO family protein [Flaviaesturariibacter terrae]
MACHGARNPPPESFPLPLGKGSGDGLTALPYYNSPDFSPQFLANADSAQKVIDHRIGTFSFADQDGRIISNRSIAGRIHVANFMFTSCGSICPIMTGELHKVARAFRGDSSVLLLSYSVTPWIDSRPRLQQYRRRNGIDSFPQWHFLTGDKGRIYSLARQSYFAEEAIGYSRDSSEFLHTEHLLLVDGSGRLRGIYNGTLALETEQLIADIRALQAEIKAPVYKARTL